MKNNKYKMAEIRDDVHHKLRMHALNHDILMRDLVTAICEEIIKDEIRLNQTIAKLANKPTRQSTS